MTDAGVYVVIRQKGGKLQPLKVFTRLREAQEFLKALPDEGKALLTHVREVWG